MARIGEDFPLSRDARRARLKEIIEADNAVGTVKVPGHGRVKVFKIPLEYLSYNPYNTRFLAQAKTFEVRLGRPLDESNQDDVREIEKFLWDLKSDKNESTIASLVKEGQLQPGVVTNDGIVLSGNRRFRLLNEISRNHASFPNHSLEGLQYFEAAILEDTLSERDIKMYESFYQYGNEDKVEYDPIQKYIAARDQVNLGIDMQDVANNFRALTDGRVSVVEKWLSIFDYMDDYLEYIDEEGIFTALTGREEAFINLYDTLKKIKSGKVGKEIWAFTELDLVDLKQRYFDYIRMGKSTHDFRLLIKIFSYEDRWRIFNNRVYAAVASSGIKSLDDYRSEYTELTEAAISNMRQADYSECVSEELNQAYDTEKRFSDDRDIENTPIKVIDAMLTKLERLSSQIDNQLCVDTFKSDAFSSKFVELSEGLSALGDRIKEL